MTETTGSGKSEREKVNRAAGTVGLYTLLSRILGLVRDVVVARFFGAGMAADAFFVAFRIPNLLRRLFAEGSLTIAFIPVFTEYLSRRSKEEAFQLARVALTLLTLVMALVTLLGIFLSPWIVRLQAFGFGGAGDKYELTVLLTRITFPYIFLISLVALFMGILNSLRHFAAPAAAPVFLNVGIIAAILWISPHLSQPIVGVALGVIIGGVLQVLLQIPWLLRNGLTLLPCWMPGHPAVRKIGGLMLPAIFGSAVYQVNSYIQTLLASFLPEGSISWLYYADRLVQFPLGVFAIAVSTAALPSFSRQVAEGNLEELRATLSHTLSIVFFITTPSMVGLMVLGRPIIEVCFERGAFDALSTGMTAQALFFYALGLWAFSGTRVLISAFYAFQDTRTPVKVATAALAANLLLGLLFMAPLKHGGLALALTGASALQFALLLRYLKRRMPAWRLRPMVVASCRSLLASGVMGLAVMGLLRVLWNAKASPGFLSQVAVLGLLLLAGVVFYLAAAWALGCREVPALLRAFGSVKIGRGSGKG